MSQQFMLNINKKHLEVIMRADQIKCDDTVLTQAILPLLFHWKSSKNKPQKMKIVYEPNVHEHMDTFTQRRSRCSYNLLVVSY